MTVHTKATAELLRKCYSVLQDFVHKFLNTNYAVSLYLNMNRLVKAEKDLKDAKEEMTQLKRICSFLRLQNFSFIINTSTRWLKKARITLAFDKQGAEPVHVDDTAPELEETTTPLMTSGLGFSPFKKPGAGLDIGSGGSIFRKGAANFGFGGGAGQSGSSASGERSSGFGMGIKGKFQ